MRVTADGATGLDSDAEVSVVIATYRRPDRLAECLQALRSQRRPPDEVVVVIHAGDEPTVRAVSPLANAWPQLRIVRVERRGSVAAYNSGLTTARGSIVAYVDDDAVPAPDWLQRIVETFSRDPRIAAVGGRDIIVSDGQVEGIDRRLRSPHRKPPVGRIQWFGRMIANHHLGEGPPRDVDVLKGVNMSFRRAAVAGHGFDERLRGDGAQVHSELSICLPLRRRGFRIVYDPSIVVEHHPAPRPRGDHRAPTRQSVLDAAHNEALQVLDYLGPARRTMYGIWGLAIGTSAAPGVAVLIRDLIAGRRTAWSLFRAAQRGRAAAWQTHGTPRQEEGGHDPLPRLLHRPELGWRRRRVFGALGLRPAVAEHSQAEAQLLMRYAAGARTVVELGVSEGGSAAELRSVMSPAGRLYLVDPYKRGRLGVAMARIVARRLVKAIHRARVTWLRRCSDEAARGWRRPIDFLFIDADHSYERAASDWRTWAPFVRPGGHVALHDSVVFAGGWTDERSGPVRLLEEIRRSNAGWTLVDQVDSLSVLRRDGSLPEGDAKPQSRLHILRVADVENIATAGMSGYMLSSGSEIEHRGNRVTYWFRDQLAPARESPGFRRLVVPWLIVGKVVRALLRGEHFDVVEIHEPLSAPYAVLARMLGPRLPASAVLSHGLTERYWAAEIAHLRVYARRPPIRSRVLVPLTLLSQARLGLCLADAVLVLSAADRDYLMRRVRVPAERVTCVNSGVASALLDVQRVPSSDVRVLFLGSWIERKGTAELVAAWRRLAADRAGVRLTLAGLGDATRARVDVRGIPRVELLPAVEREELPGVLAAHDVFVLDSWFEGMPLSMLEAAAAGLACVVSSVCGNLDVFRPDDPARDGAILIPPSDASALYRALITLMDDSQLRADLGARARERARRFTWARTADRSLDAFTDALHRRDVSAAR